MLREGDIVSAKEKEEKCYSYRKKGRIFVEPTEGRGRWKRLKNNESQRGGGKAYDRKSTGRRSSEGHQASVKLNEGGPTLGKTQMALLVATDVKRHQSLKATMPGKTKKTY